MPKVRKQIEDSKLKRDFKKRQKVRSGKHKTKKTQEKAQVAESSRKFVEEVKHEKREE